MYVCAVWGLHHCHHMACIAMSESMSWGYLGLLIALQLGRYNNLSLLSLVETGGSQQPFAQAP